MNTVMQERAASKPTASAFVQSRRTVMLVEDDAPLAQLIADYLSKRDLEVVCERRGDRVLERVAQVRPDLMVLDVMLPGKDGFEICRALRAHGSALPILMLTAREEDFDQVLGLELGADDYLTKPVQPRVLLAHIRAILRRVDSDAREPDGGTLEFGELVIDHRAREARLGGQMLELSTAEFDLLWLLASNAGRVLSRIEILKALRGLEYDGTDRSIDTRIYRLRRKLGDETNPPTRVKTVRPQGYLFSPTAW